MNPLQIAQQIKHVLATLTWPGGSQDLVFGARGVFVFAGTPTEEQIPAGFPWAMVGLDTGTPDEDQPELIRQGLTILMAAEVAGDPLGEFSMIGGAAADLGKSVGRGILEVMSVARPAIQDLVTSDGAQIMVSSASFGTPATLGGGRHIAVSELNIEALCVSSLHYASPQEIRHSGSTFSWDGSPCSNRFDFLQYRLVSKSGSPSADPTDGTVIYTGTTASFTGSGPGNYYTAFADYNARGGSTVEGSSDPVVGSYIAI